MMSPRFSLSIVALALGVALAVNLGTPQPSPSQQVATSDDVASVRLPTARHGHRVHLVGEILLIFGGFAPGQPSDGMNQVLAYDFGRKSWRRMADMKVGKAFFGSAVVGKAVFAVGDGVIERYDLGRDAWEVVCRDGLLPRTHLSAAAVGEKLYVVGGLGGSAQGTVLVFDTRGNALTKLDPPLPGLKGGDHFHVVAALGRELHVAGGLDGETFAEKAEHWAYADGRWKRLPDAPNGLFAKFAVVEVAGDALYYFTKGHGLRFERGKGWSRVAGLPELVAMPGSFVREGQIHCLGGQFVDEREKRLVYVIAHDKWKVAKQPLGHGTAVR